MKYGAILIGILTLILLISITCDAKRSGGGGSRSRGGSRHYSSSYSGSKSGSSSYSGSKSGSSSTGGFWNFMRSVFSSTPTKKTSSTPTKTHKGYQPSPIGWNVHNQPKPSAPEYHHKSKAVNQPVPIGWNVISQPKPSAPENHHASKTGALYPPQEYNNLLSVYDFGSNHGHNPSVHQGYNPVATHYGNNPFPTQPQSVKVQSHKPGIGEIIQESALNSIVDAGVKSVINRLIPGGIYGHSRGFPTGETGPASNTHITHNNHYDNGNPGPAARNTNSRNASESAQTTPDGTSVSVQLQGNNENLEQNITSSSEKNITNDELNNTTSSQAPANIQEEKKDAHTTDHPWKSIDITCPPSVLELFKKVTPFTIGLICGNSN